MYVHFFTHIQENLCIVFIIQRSLILTARFVTEIKNTRKIEKIIGRKIKIWITPVQVLGRLPYTDSHEEYKM